MAGVVFVPEVQRVRLMERLAWVWLICGVVLLGGCTQKLTMVRVDEASLYTGTGKNVISTHAPSVATKVVLGEFGLRSLYWEDPDQALRELYQAYLTRQRPDMLVALAELCYDQARNRPMTRTRRADYDASCALAAYTVLIQTQESRMPVVTLERIRLARELYNRSLAWVLIDPVRKLRRDVPLNVVYADCVVDMRLVESHVTHLRAEADTFAHPYEIMVLGLRSRVETQGIGAPLIGMRKADPFNEDPLEAYMLAGRVCYPVVAVMSFGDGLARPLPRRMYGDVKLYNAQASDTVPFGKYNDVPAQINYTVPIAIMLEDQPRLWILGGLLSPADWERQSGLFMGQPYQKGKIPVVLVHGLASSYHIWLDMANELRADPVLRKHYQFWIYSYFTGSPVEYSAYRFRLQLKAVHEQVQRSYGPDEAAERMVIVGHSMGGLLSRTAVQQSSPDLLGVYLKRQTPGFLESKALSTRLSEDSRAQLSRWLTYSPLSFVKRVVFIAVPHRGSDIADSMFGRTISSMVAVPDGVMSFSGQVFEGLFDPKSVEIRQVGKRYYTGIDSLSSQDPVLRAGVEQAFAKDVRLNSIVGNVYTERKDKKLWTDRVVPYDSAHLVPAESERVVPYAHSMTGKDLVIEEVRRILLLNLVSEGKAEVVEGVKE